jgi:hypothetical protein
LDPGGGPPQNPNIGVPRRTYTTLQTDAAPFSLFSRTTNVRVVPGAGHGHVGCSRCHARPGLVWDRRYPGHGHDARMTPTQTSPGPVRHPPGARMLPCWPYVCMCPGLGWTHITDACTGCALACPAWWRFGQSCWGVCWKKNGTCSLGEAVVG